jgi:hypothetical protein
MDKVHKPSGSEACLLFKYAIGLVVRKLSNSLGLYETSREH